MKLPAGNTAPTALAHHFLRRHAVATCIFPLHPPPSRLSADVRLPLALPDTSDWSRLQIRVSHGMGRVASHSQARAKAPSGQLSFSSSQTRAWYSLSHCTSDADRMDLTSGDKLPNKNRRDVWFSKHKTSPNTQQYWGSLEAAYECGGQSLLCPTQDKQTCVPVQNQPAKGVPNSAKRTCLRDRGTSAPA